ncbi:winged helix-turn-helix domain-containing protein [Pseudofulvibacter geojedonensis]|uniref:Winged helix-turn-helix domain-containing protein n=1 Tax=Pseudofulvibacter geojedonensis TaxID=1123758 RepID=A0ABW3I1C3_9FLAO
MNKGILYIVLGCVVSLIGIILLFPVKEKVGNKSELVRLSLREVGNQLLLANQDSTSLVLPIREVSPNKYQLSFQESLSINPDSLLNTVKNSFDKTNLKSNYLVEVVKCKEKEVAYSYQIMNFTSEDIIPCRGRELPESCYDITVKFKGKPKANKSNWLTVLMIGLGVVLVFLGIRLKKPNTKINIGEGFNATYNEAERIGMFLFYPEQSKLVKEAEEISLSVKECELLSIFIERPNEVIKREELSKKVWEDKGVVVGRSLDTYISKLRKKLKSDNNIKLTNVHGVGYKLEVNL